jgi:phosphate starvation-inducible PhoH-like protein
MSKKDNSPRVTQRDKIDKDFEIKEFQWTEKQKILIDLILDKKNQIFIIKSPPGTGKTLISIFTSLLLLREKKVGEILFLRNPIESCSTSIGFLAGDKKVKLDAHAGPLFSVLRELVNKSTSDFLFKDERIKIDSIGFIKGITISNTCCILEEAEDASWQDLRLVMSRMGKFSKLFIIGDENQQNSRYSGFLKLFNLFNDNESKENGIITYEFNRFDCMRNGIIKFILEKFESIS